MFVEYLCDHIQYTIAIFVIEIGLIRGRDFGGKKNLADYTKIAVPFLFLNTLGLHVF